MTLRDLLIRDLFAVADMKLTTVPSEELVHLMIHLANKQYNLQLTFCPLAEAARVLSGVLTTLPQRERQNLLVECGQRSDLTAGNHGTVHYFPISIRTIGDKVFAIMADHYRKGEYSYESLERAFAQANVELYKLYGLNLQRDSHRCGFFSLEHLLQLDGFTFNSLLSLANENNYINWNEVAKKHPELIWFAQSYTALFSWIDQLAPASQITDHPLLSIPRGFRQQSFSALLTENCRTGNSENLQNNAVHSAVIAFSSLTYRSLCAEEMTEDELLEVVYGTSHKEVYHFIKRTPAINTPIMEFIFNNLNQFEKCLKQAKLKTVLENKELQQLVEKHDLTYQQLLAPLFITQHNLTFDKQNLALLLQNRSVFQQLKSLPNLSQQEIIALLYHKKLGITLKNKTVFHLIYSGKLDINTALTLELHRASIKDLDALPCDETKKTYLLKFQKRQPFQELQENQKSANICQFWSEVRVELESDVAKTSQLLPQSPENGTPCVEDNKENRQRSILSIR